MKVLYCLVGLLLIVSPSLCRDSGALNKKFALQGTTLVYNSNLSVDPNLNYITFDDVKDFKQYLDKNDIKTLRLTSKGGQQGAMLDIKDLVLKHKLDTEAKGECERACSIIFIAGQKRSVIGKAKLGFHTTFTKIDDFEKRKKIVEGYDDRLDYENTIAYFSKVSAVNEIVFFQTQEIDFYFALRVLKVHPIDMWYPKLKDLFNYRVLN